MIKTILFDLDGTLLPMDQEIFTRAYFKALCRKMAPRGYEPEKLVEAIWKGTAAMVANDGTATNEAAFWRVFGGIFGEKAAADKPVFEEFYANEFHEIREVCGYTPAAGRLIAALKGLGYTLVLASNPIFPLVAQRSRMAWAGLDPSDFVHITCYENAGYCKPNPAYYREILEKLNLRAEECLMIGNDACEDLAAREAGLDVFLLTDCLINTAGVDITPYPHGSYEQALAYVESLG